MIEQAPSFLILLPSLVCSCCFELPFIKRKIFFEMAERKNSELCRVAWKSKNNLASNGPFRNYVTPPLDFSRNLFGFFSQNPHLKRYEIFE